MMVAAFEARSRSTGSAYRDAGTTGDEKPKPPVTCSLKADAGPFVAAGGMGEGAVQLTVLCPAEMFDMSTHQPGETLVPMQEIA